MGLLARRSADLELQQSQAEQPSRSCENQIGGFGIRTWHRSTVQDSCFQNAHTTNARAGHQFLQAAEAKQGLKTKNLQGLAKLWN